MENKAEVVETVGDRNYIGSTPPTIKGNKESKQGGSRREENVVQKKDSREKYHQWENTSMFDEFQVMYPSHGIVGFVMYM